ncbi:MAG TPA: glucose-1-phosphate adenylyltransferase [Rhodopirellula baltica]|uniref:Glucose-1-phosphate adenylyltransferase n=2 Tax=Rhodopirellula baltica TaxID=265606 RepID=Q7UEY7_RHOBA|nr:glucose-1-phosphate adenylyltransferase [Rhodopirellula baltica]ELP33944.1 glucose-1-phosphate adenylyltransferase [Rhodopirellula baltica SWK14]CAD78897.1 glucose-1-phosphate adenylyltransferase [Rhodopirellula baltica SH 1]HBE64494.1 glucose-1-phosphate adenylyltransferase [Rhodopirellula baltica]
MIMDLNNTIALILGGGRGTRLFPLTKIRAKPAVPLAAKYRLIDIPISNCINSGLNRAYVLTQFLSESLHRHLRQTYTFDHFSGGFVELLAAQQTVNSGTDWYQGTADAVRKNLVHLRESWIKHVLILSGDQLYRMDFRDMMKTHIESGAAATIAGIPVTRKDASALGIMQVDDTGRVTGFVEKPQTEEEIAKVRMEPSWIDARGIESQGRDLLASMGLYIFDKDLMVDMLENSLHSDFGKEVFPEAINTHKVQLHLFDGYWEDIGTIRSFYEANLSLASKNPPFDIRNRHSPIYSRPRFLPPTIMGDAKITGSLIADGCRIGDNVTIENSVIGLRTVIGDNVTIKDSVVMGADFIEMRGAERDGKLPVGVGAGSVIQGAILDKNCRVGENVRILNEAKVDHQGEDDDLQIRDGISIVIKDGQIPDGFSC